jgi:hypothetical protein
VVDKIIIYKLHSFLIKVWTETKGGLPTVHFTVGAKQIAHAKILACQFFGRLPPQKEKVLIIFLKMLKLGLFYTNIQIGLAPMIFNTKIYHPKQVFKNNC